MADQVLVDAVQRVREATQQAVVAAACDQALRNPTEGALRAALIKTSEAATTWVAKEIADRALGLKGR